MVNLMSKNLTKLILMVDLMRQKFNPLTISAYKNVSQTNFRLVNLDHSNKTLIFLYSSK
jgi:hypothetical protein